MPSPAILVSAGLVPSSSGPLKPSSARATRIPPRLASSSATPQLANNFRIVPAPFTLEHSRQTITSDATTRFRFHRRKRLRMGLVCFHRNATEKLALPHFPCGLNFLRVRLPANSARPRIRSEEHTSELKSRLH